MPMATSSVPEEAASSVDESSDWTSALTEAPTMVVFDTLGDEFIGTYLGYELIQFTDPKEGEKEFKQYKFVGTDGVIYGINSTYRIDKGMADVPEGKLTRIVYVKDVDVNRPQPMRDFSIQYKA